jgi:hypothetical protein
MRGIYQVKSDTEMLDRAIGAGIDTLLIPFYDIPGRPISGLDTWEQNVAVCEQFKDRARVIAVPVLFPHWCVFPEDQQFIQNGVKLPGHFCPTSAAYEELMVHFRDLVNRGIIHEVILDVEHYSGHPKYFSAKIPCETDFCKQIGWDGQWKHRKIMMAKDTFISGQLAIDSKWSVDTLPRKRVLAEGTYPKTGLMMRLQLAATKFWNKIDTIVPGAYIECFQSTDEFIKYLGYLKSSCPYDGYWIYSQMALTRNCTMSSEAVVSLAKSYGHYDIRRIDERDPAFFEKLKTLNG